MDVKPNYDHRMPQNIDVFDHIEKCARDNLCCVWGCGKPADVNSQTPIKEAAFTFPVPFCEEHAKGFRAVNEAVKSGEVPEGLEPHNAQ